MLHGCCNVNLLQFKLDRSQSYLSNILCNDRLNPSGIDLPHLEKLINFI